MQRPAPEKHRISIPEILLTLIVGAALIGGAYAVYKLAMRDKKVDAAIAQIDEIRQLDFTASDGNLLNPWEGKIYSEHADNTLRITLEGIPPQSCQMLALHYTPVDTGFVKSIVGGTTFGEGFEELKAETVTAACTASETTILTWVFK